MPNPQQPNHVDLQELTLKSPFEVLGLNAEKVRELAANPEALLRVCKGLYRAQSGEVHSDLRKSGSSDAAMAALNQAWSDLNQTGALPDLVNHYTRVTNVHEENKALKLGLQISQRELAAAALAGVRMIEISARTILGKLGDIQSAEAMHGKVVKLRNDGELLRSGGMVAGEGYDVTAIEELDQRIARLKERKVSGPALESLQVKRGLLESRFYRSVKVGQDGLITDSETSEPRAPSVTLILPFEVLSRGTDLPALLTKAGLKVAGRKALASGASGSQAPSKAEDFNTTTIPAAAIAKLARYLSKEIRPSTDTEQVYLFSAYSYPATGETLYFLEGRVEQISSCESAKSAREGVKPKKRASKDSEEKSTARNASGNRSGRGKRSNDKR